MLQEASELIGRQCYTNMGMYLGSVTNLVIDVDSAKIDGIFISDTNPLLVEGSRPVNVPYRWISNVGDIILLKYFPKRVGGKEKAVA
ncbi:MAG: PRC-barrel domain-containing protein [Thermoplasmata archaeon]|nr:PRC-barrel domain-containing protein [Candidatus Sysuiplasma acidicola]MBX8638216.1 PRC-barrel domain-containing protein [Candidatus Sysuiplasma acidicola]MBX8645980.1 PRC-barrel domain-containing protein [Candidatus Sysuiplasma acidicola]MDH2906231.1 PRC-barrel domain-containing protein [Methanomassiliicoccales archaeon]